MSDYGGGRWRLCLTEPILATAEGTAWCVWSPDRSTVIQVGGRAVRIEARDYESWIAFAPSAFELNIIDAAPEGLGGHYRPDSSVPIGDAVADRRAGGLAFNVALEPDPELGAPPGMPRAHAGFIRWTCADPPPPS